MIWVVFMHYGTEQGSGPCGNGPDETFMSRNCDNGYCQGPSGGWLHRPRYFSDKDFQTLNHLYP